MLPPVVAVPVSRRRTFTRFNSNRVQEHSATGPSYRQFWSHGSSTDWTGGTWCCRGLWTGSELTRMFSADEFADWPWVCWSGSCGIDSTACNDLQMDMAFGMYLCNHCDWFIVQFIWLWKMSTKQKHAWIQVADVDCTRPMFSRSIFTIDNHATLTLRRWEIFGN